MAALKGGIVSIVIRVHGKRVANGIAEALSTRM